MPSTGAASHRSPTPQPPTPGTPSRRHSARTGGAWGAYMSVLASGDAVDGQHAKRASVIGIRWLAGLESCGGGPGGDLFMAGKGIQGKVGLFD
ncbi:hypothetical protein V492_01011 [Pseudogymnoascus sp. VKM F-4246]|nr:hypothetical protein V492_01011 [Pseudogymnoascus sp. VKM F-4246]